MQQEVTDIGLDQQSLSSSPDSTFQLIHLGTKVPSTNGY